jgi:hypothetical protein
MRKLLLLFCMVLLASCYNSEPQCKDFKIGKFHSEVTVKGVKISSVSIRTDSTVIETFEGRTDTASIRWISDCEYIVQKLRPKNREERKSIDIKILTTSKNSYTFEFGAVGEDYKLRGKATRIN